jgi:hypothetical protein
MTLWHNCGNKQPKVIVRVDRYRDDGGGASHKEIWCLECIQGKNPLRQQFDIPTDNYY